MTEPVPPGFEASHAEWLGNGGRTFYQARPDFYESQYWNLVREAVLNSRGFKCCRCGGEANQVHHLNYDFIGEDHFHPETLVAICRPCHGLVEYARKAESLVSRISRRIALCKGFLDGKPNCRDQNATHVFARLLEYRDELAELQCLFRCRAHYNSPLTKSRANLEAVLTPLQMKRAAYERQAQNLVSTWNGSENAKTTQLLPMLEQEITNCQRFVVEVFAPAQDTVTNLSTLQEETKL